jgi:hypothetical protein
MDSNDPMKKSFAGKNLCGVTAFERRQEEGPTPSYGEQTLK